MGEVPNWYSLIKAARYLGVPPWDLATRPVYWINLAIVCESLDSTSGPTKV
jgi:hypothetical protein